MDENGSKQSVRLEVFRWIASLALAFVFIYALNNVVIVHATVPTESMESTIPAGTRVIGFRLSYLFSEPGRFDVIAFSSPDGTDTHYIKRVIGLPGETVDIVNGMVFINGGDEPLDEWYLFEPPAGISLVNQSFAIPEGHYFVMGDHRNISRDSRGLCLFPWDNLFICESIILGRAVFTYFPNLGLVR